MGAVPVEAWRHLAGPISWWEQIDSNPAMTPASTASIDGVGAELRAVFARAGVDITDPTVLHAALMIVAFIRISARRDACSGRISADEASTVFDATNPVGIALTRWVPTEGRPS